jgi:hypothetical protein
MKWLTFPLQQKLETTKIEKLFNLGPDRKDKNSQTVTS